MIEKAKYELDLLLNQCEDEEEKQMQESINNHILEMVKIFAEYGHSGVSAEYTIDILIRLLKQQNITPLTLKDDEFIEVSDGLFQNIRDFRIFKDKNKFNGKPYNVNTNEVLEKVSDDRNL